MFAREPIPGQVKTRLAARLGAEPAARLYGAFISDLVETMQAGPHRLVLVVTPADAVPRFSAWYGVETWPQADGDLGCRMAAALSQALPGKAVLIGSDLPHMPLSRPRSAFAALDDHDVVLGSTEDGGYDLVGMKAPLDIFSGMRWSHAAVLSDTLARCTPYRTQVLEQTFDVDDFADVRRLTTMPLGRHTRRALDNLA